MPPPPTSLDTLIGLAFERFRALCHPANREPSPVRTGATPAEWAVAAGIHGEDEEPIHPVEEIREEHPRPLDVGLHHPATVAHQALQRLCGRAEVDRVPGVEMRYRPRAR